MLQQILQDKQCFKLVCGAGNEDSKEVEKLVALYAKAGANYFDLSAKEEIVKAAYSGLARVVPENKRKDYYFNVSVGIKGDPHVSKALINENECIACGACYKKCVQGAIIKGISNYQIDQKRCIGCSRCVEICSKSAISTISENKDLSMVLPQLIDLDIDSIELHVVSEDINKIFEQWKIINKHFKGILSICTDRSHAGDIQLISMIKEMIKDREMYSTIIQADGAPMSGCDDKYETTLQAIATAQIVQRANLPVFIMLSGGTNSKTTELARLCNINSNGIAIGSYGRMIVKDYIDREDFFENEQIFNKALEIAKELVDKCLREMK
ncbi:LdpA C-terminal domain-containing domain [Clostridium botulinum]|uniref:Light dependent period protein LdpA domain-containing protein n=1 Tax=Clostridium botulinum TaxID=1491 RepID=UPI001967C580|nr:LdpA C-terminal domain-containing domain [Clostridium botulinum]